MPSGRRLVIHRRTGLFRQFVITPTQRYVFKKELESAIRKFREAYQPGVPVETPPPDDSDTAEFQREQDASESSGQRQPAA